MVVAAVGVWFGGRVDRVIQWLSEVNMLLPILPLAIMVYFTSTKSIWAILAVIVVLSSFGRSLKNLRAALLQVREQPYVEAAQSYGAGNARIILRYLVPRVIPVLVPQLVIMIPGFVFLEATLAIVGVRDLYLPTWGKTIHDALMSGVLHSHYYWVLEPIALLMLTGLAFAMLGYSLDRVFNPRLRSMRVGRE
jgi:peptide/nickel transport system permease protein